VRLYHLTTKAARDSITDDGAIVPTWPRVPGEGWPWPRVVWLTAEPDPDRQGWKVAQPLEVRFAVDVPDDEVHAWSACSHDLPRRVVSALEKWGRPADWYVVRRSIPASEWAEVIDSTSASVATTL
jgi:hypothetical protein